MDFSFFTTNNKSGYKTNQKWFSTNYPQDYSEIINYCSKLDLDLNFKEQIWFYFNNLTERPKCLTCDGEVKFRNRFDKPYGDFCSLDCINNNKDEMIKRQKQTFNEKYGVDFYPQHNEFIIKQKNTKFIKYGNEKYNNIDKGKETKKNRYGDSKYNNYSKYIKTCITKYSTDNYSKSNNYRNKIIQNYKELYPDVKFVEIKKDYVTIKCDKCDNECEITKQLLYERYKRNYVICTSCNPIGFSNRSGYESEICEFLDKLNVKYETNKKIQNKKTEIDIFLPDYNLGIEFNGVYWHNELFKSSSYHLDKTVDCQNNGIDLIHIFEDEWIYKKEIVQSIIKNKLNLNAVKIYGRKCEIREINSNESKKFLENNHIQGGVNSKVRVGLFYDNNLVSLMTFSKGRVIMGGKKTEWELNRFCNIMNVNVIGAASKLLNYFIKTYNPTTIISYSDIRIFDGKMYEKLNFKMIAQSKPNYWYVLNGIRKYRFNFRKTILVKEGYDPNKTEKQIMFERKIYRIYDCGNIRWELTID